MLIAEHNKSLNSPTVKKKKLKKKWKDNFNVLKVIFNLKTIFLKPEDYSSICKG